MISIQSVQKHIYDWAETKGWNKELLIPFPTHPDTRPDMRLRAMVGIALEHRALSNAIEALRVKGSTVPSVHVDHTDNITGSPVNVFAILEKLVLVHSEVSEAVTAVLERGVTGWLDPKRANVTMPAGKPEGLGSELADIAIRIIHLAAMCKIDLQAEIARKMAYNEGRPFKHGKIA